MFAVSLLREFRGEQLRNLDKLATLKHVSISIVPATHSLKLTSSPAAFLLLNFICNIIWHTNVAPMPRSDHMVKHFFAKLFLCEQKKRAVQHAMLVGFLALLCPHKEVHVKEEINKESVRKERWRKVIN